MDQRQFIQYVENNQRAVRRFLTVLCCGDAALADDLAQDTFVKAYLSSDDFREESKFSTWVYRIAYNTFVSHRRSYRPVDSLGVAECVADERHADTGLEYQALYQALDRLSDKERSAVVLYYMQGYSISEVAEITGASVDAVKQQLSRGRTHLKCLIKE